MLSLKEFLILTYNITTFINKKQYSGLFYGVKYMAEPSRPLDALNRARDKRVIVELKNNKTYMGKLKAFDIHINVVLEDAEEHIDGQVKRKLGVIFIRGDTITVISPE